MNHLFIALFFVFSGTLNAKETKLHILSWNIKMLPRQYNIVIKHHPLKRIKLISEQILSDSIDIVCFQELFDTKVNKRMKAELSKQFPYVVGPANEARSIFRLSSGVIFFSRYPIRKLETVEFSDCQEEDCVARKGALLIEAEVDGKKIQLLGTHMNAAGGEDVKIKQLVQIRTLIEKHSKSGIPQLICGDFNIKKTNGKLYQMMLDFFKANDGPILGAFQHTFDPKNNDMCAKEKEEPQLIDFIFFRSNETREAKESSREIRCYRKDWGKKNKDLSDHFALLMEVIL
jgi:endonuclease/exonuclease/phosphatase family metal-dependent hydrolase